MLVIPEHSPYIMSKSNGVKFFANINGYHPRSPSFPHPKTPHSISRLKKTPPAAACTVIHPQSNQALVLVQPRLLLHHRSVRLWEPLVSTLNGGWEVARVLRLRDARTQRRRWRRRERKGREWGDGLLGLGLGRWRRRHHVSGLRLPEQILLGWAGG